MKTFAPFAGHPETPDFTFSSTWLDNNETYMYQFTSKPTQHKPYSWPPHTNAVYRPILDQILVTSASGTGRPHLSTKRSTITSLQH